MEKQNSGQLIFAIIENVFRQKPFYAAVGDIFLTNEGLYFIPYRVFQCAGKLGGAVGAAIGGLVGGITVAIGDKQNAGDAIQKAAELRIQQFGLSLHDRITSDGWTITLLKKSIESINISKNLNTLTCTTYDADPLEFLLPSLNDQQLHVIMNYLEKENTLLPIDTKHYGFNLPYLAPMKFLKILLEKVNPGIDMIKGVENDTIWLQNFYLLLKQLPVENIRKASSAIIRSKLTIQDPIYQLAKMDIRKSLSIRNNLNNKVLYGTLVFFTVLLFAIDRQCLVENDMGNFGGNTILFSIVIVCNIIFIFWPRRKANAILRGLSI